ncbi:MAG: hypothetical protein K6347_08230 [Campylobacterales bacterium]
MVGSIQPRLYQVGLTRPQEEKEDRSTSQQESRLIYGYDTEAKTLYAARVTSEGEIISSSPDEATRRRLAAERGIGLYLSLSA